MKKIYFVCFLSFFISNAQINQNNPLDYSDFDLSDLKTSFFIKYTSPLSPLGKEFNESSLLLYKQLIKELHHNKINDSEILPRLYDYPLTTYGNMIKIGLVHANYESLNSNLLESGTISIDNNKVKRNSTDYIFNNYTTTVITPLSVTKKGLFCEFLLDSANYFNNSNEEITKIEADFDDGNGYVIIRLDRKKEIQYNTTGDKNIRFKITLNNGSVVEQSSKLKVVLNRSDLQTRMNRMPTDLISSITPDLSSYSGATNFSGMGEYEIFLGADGILNKPIILADGFDPGDARDISAVYQMLNYDDNGTTQNLADDLRNNEDFDIVIVNFPSYLRLADNTLLSLGNASDTNNDGVIDANDYTGSTMIDGGVDFIERNAMLLLDVINLINSTKTTDAEQNVVIGPSMGGLISRYALNYMENNGLNHDTRLWVSFDSPHLGANVPIGFQHLFNFLAYGLDTWVGDFSIESLKPVVDGMLKSPAARQMLIDHYETHLANGSIADFDPNKLTPEPHPYFNTFYSSMNGLTSSGFPENTRKISLANGSGLGNPFLDKDGNPVLPGRRALNAFIPNVALLTDATLKAWYTTYADEQKKISDVFIDAPFLCFCDIRTDEEARSPSHTDGADTAPGGLFDIAKLGEGFGTDDPTINAFFDSLETDYFNFIPTVSSLALSTNPSPVWFQNINLGAGDEPWDDTVTDHPETPFDNWFIPDNNEDHVTLTAQNLVFVLNEIIRPYISIAPKAFLQGPLLSNGDFMRDDLRSNGLIPLTSPYNDALTLENTVLNTTGNNAIIDWVSVELRDKNDISNVIASRSALIQSDGDIVDLDGISPIKWFQKDDAYFLGINHRNHLGIVTNTTINLDKATTSLNFTDESIELYGTNALTNIGLNNSSTYALWAGDALNTNSVSFTGENNGSNQIKSIVLSDNLNILDLITFSSSGYLSEDIDLNGFSKFSGNNNDSNILKNNCVNHPANILNFISYRINAQLP